MGLRGALSVAICGGSLLGCASVDVERIPLCASLESLQPLPEVASCGEAELADYASALSDRIVDRGSRALVRVEFDDAARVRSVCVDEGVEGYEGVKSYARRTRQELAEQLDVISGVPPGPSCVAGKRLDLNRYEAKVAEIEEAQSWCASVGGYRMMALAEGCTDFDSDWILFDRVGSMRPYLYMKPESAQPPDVPASDTLTRCGRTKWGFEARSECIQAEGFELLTPPLD